MNLIKLGWKPEKIMNGRWLIQIQNLRTRRLPVGRNGQNPARSLQGLGQPMKRIRVRVFCDRVHRRAMTYKQRGLHNYFAATLVAGLAASMRRLIVSSCPTTGPASMILLYVRP